MPEHQLRAAYAADAHSLVVGGVVDEAEVDEFRVILQAAAACDPDRELLVNLSDVAFLSSMALGVLAGVRRRGYRMHLHAEAGTTVARILQVTGLAGSPAETSRPER